MSSDLTISEDVYDPEMVWRFIPPVDMDIQFDLCQSHAVVLNMFDFASEEFSDLVRNSVFHTSSEVDFVATCQCEHLRGNYLIGTTCPECHTEVRPDWSVADDHLRFRNWLSCPDKLPDGWLNPRAYLMLSRWLAHRKTDTTNYLDDILDTTTPIPVEISGVIKGKGFQYLHDNFDEIMNFFMNDFTKTAKKPITEFVRSYLVAYRHLIWCHYVPLASSALHPILSNEGTDRTKRQYSDTKADHILAAISGLSKLTCPSRRKNRQDEVEKTTYKAYKEFIAYIDELYDIVVDGKSAMPRSHIAGARLHWTIRTVITPISEPHDPDELWMPQKLMVSNFRVHLLGVLCREYGLSQSDAIKKHTNALVTFDPDIHEILERFVRESPFKGIPLLWHRPPTIRDGSIMCLFMTHIKKDMYDETVGIPPVLCTPFNADFDGDNQIGTLLLETDMANAFMRIHPRSLIMSRNAPVVSEDIKVHKELCVTINSFLRMV